MLPSGDQIGWKYALSGEVITRAPEPFGFITITRPALSRMAKLPGASIGSGTAVVVVLEGGVVASGAAEEVVELPPGEHADNATSAAHTSRHRTRVGPGFISPTYRPPTHTGSGCAQMTGICC
jgi:hypothetical protein